MYIPNELISDFFRDINQFGIQYVLIKNIGGELPDHLINGKDIDILVLEKDKNIFEKKMQKSGYSMVTHPLGVANGWSFAYNLPEYQFWKKKDTEFELYIDASFKLCCKSFMPKVWIPLDKKINKDIWKNRLWDEKNEWWILDEKTELIYLLVRCIFDKHVFSEVYISEIERRKELLSESEVIEKLRLIFFRFTETLVDLVKKGQYESIIEQYITFCDY